MGIKHFNIGFRTRFVSKRKNRGGIYELVSWNGEVSDKFSSKGGMYKKRYTKSSII